VEVSAANQSVDDDVCLSTPSFDYNDVELAGMRDEKNRFDPL